MCISSLFIFAFPPIFETYLYKDCIESEGIVAWGESRQGRHNKMTGGVVNIRRKVVLHGNSTLTVSLPTAWVKRYNIAKGDELNIEEYEKELKITNEKESGPAVIEVNIRNLRRLGKSYITSSYRCGYDEIHASFEDEHYLETIQKLVSMEMTGFEIIRQGARQGTNYCVIKDLTGHTRDEFDNALRRMWLLALELSRQSLNALASHDSGAMQNIQMIDYNINRLCNYCLRFLVKRGHASYRKTPVYYHIIKNIETIADQYKDLCRFYLSHAGKIQGGFIDDFASVNSCFSEFYELFYRYDEERLEALFRKTEDCCPRWSISTFSACLDKSMIFLPNFSHYYPILAASF
jgi:phosphate uptake regulator